MILAMAGFAVGDALVKTSSANMSIAQVLIFMALPGLAIFTTLAIRAGQSPFSRDVFLRPVLLRNCIESVAALCMVSALALAPLALVISITQAVPLFVTLGAAIILNEHVGPRRWIAVIVGFIGVFAYPASFCGWHNNWSCDRPARSRFLICPRYTHPYYSQTDRHFANGNLGHCGPDPCWACNAAFHRTPCNAKR